MEKIIYSVDKKEQIGEIITQLECIISLNIGESLPQEAMKDINEIIDKLVFLKCTVFEVANENSVKVLQEIAGEIITKCINSIDTFILSYEPVGEALEDAESVIHNLEQLSVMEKSYESCIYDAMVNYINDCSDIVIINESTQAKKRAMNLGDNCYIAVEHEGLVMYVEGIKVLVIKRDSKLLENLLDTIDDAMRGNSNEK